MTATIELWQTEWCPASHRIRQRFTELGVPFLARPVQVAREDRDALERATGTRTIPVLVAEEETVIGEEAIRAHLNTHYNEPPEAAAQRDKAAMAKRKELEKACPELMSATR
ncbi:MAG: glutaredoxin family protein [Solirubrobacteraceae bacterium]